MNILELINKWLSAAAGEVVDLKAALVAAKEAKPDLAPILDPIIAALDAPVNVSHVALAVRGEIINIGQGKLDGREHPSDGF